MAQVREKIRKKNRLKKIKADLNQMMELIESKKAGIAFIGLGQAGLPAAVLMASAGFNVIGCDINKSKLESIRNGKSYSEDVTDSQLSRFIKNGKITLTSEISDLTDADIFILAVPTYLTKQKTPDVTAVEVVVEKLVPVIKKQAMIILESTIYPGATEDIIESRLNKRGLIADKDYYLAYSPSRIDPGNKKWPLSKIPRLVGGLTDNSREAAAALYSRIGREVIAASSIKAAEMTKLYENSFRAINIAFADDMHVICHAFGLDVWEIVELAKTKPFGFVPFSPGPGIGGECIPIVPLFTAWKAREYGLRADFIELASDIIDMMPRYFTHYLTDLLNVENKTIKDAKILIIGVAYKCDTADTRESPALAIMRLLRERGADISYSDPFVSSLKENGTVLKSLPISPTLLRRTDAVIIATDHSSIDYATVVKYGRLILDTRNALKNFQSPNIFR